jgi:hypothetical protein
MIYMRKTPIPGEGIDVLLYSSYWLTANRDDLRIVFFAGDLIKEIVPEFSQFICDIHNIKNKINHKYGNQC